MSRRHPGRVRAVVAGVALAAVFGPPVHTQDTLSREEALRAMTAGGGLYADPLARFWIFNECRPVGLTIQLSGEGVATYLPTRAHLQSLVEGRLRAARLYGSLFDDNYLSVRVTAIPTSLPEAITQVGVPYSIEVAFRKSVQDKVQDRIYGIGLSGSAITWQVLYSGFGDANFIAEHVSDGIDHFLLEYLRVNEPACGGP